MTNIQPIHPFPARMAPEIALAEINQIAPGSIILDPMSGSGTVIRNASERQHEALGFDMDPLAVLMSRVWTTPIDTDGLENAAHQVVERVRNIATDDLELPWIDQDEETQQFINFWFGPNQRADLRRLSYGFSRLDGPAADAMRVAMSRLIITKNDGASLANDVSHSRPHRVRVQNDFEVMPNFERSVRFIARRLRNQPPPGNVCVCEGDARCINEVGDCTVDAVISSPPYLNALDYMRGHKMTLVWLGYQCRQLRTIRADSVGAERRPNPDADLAVAAELIARLHGLEGLSVSQRAMINRYVLDLLAVVREAYRVVKPGGKTVYVVGNSCLRDVFINNAQAVKTVAERVGFVLTMERERVIPNSKRYLPPPSSNEESTALTSDLAKRMRTETILNFRKPEIMM